MERMAAIQPSERPYLLNRVLDLYPATGGVAPAADDLRLLHRSHHHLF